MGSVGKNKEAVRASRQVKKRVVGVLIKKWNVGKILEVILGLKLLLSLIAKRLGMTNPTCNHESP